MVCRHGSFAIEINDQDKEFVNEMSNELHLLKGVHQWVTNAYHPQSNGLVERQNRAIKNSFVKVWKENPLKQLSIIKGVLFAHHIVVITTAQLHSSKPELRFCAGPNPACGVSEIRDGENLWQWSGLEIRLNAFHRSTTPQKQFIIIIIVIIITRLSSYYAIKNQCYQ